METRKTKCVNSCQQAPKPVVLETVGIHKAFGTNRVLNGFSFSLHRGENVVVLGRSGSGKSVLIKCIIGLLPIDEGTIVVFGAQVPELGGSALDEMRQKVGFLFQSNALYDSMTVRENLLFSLRRHRLFLTATAMEVLVMEALEDVDLAYTIDMLPAELSGGMRKRIALARTLILKPQIILYDEPTTGLDPITGAEISALLIRVQKKYNTSAVIISHDMRCVRQTADRIVLLHEGRCYAEGLYSELKASDDPNIYHYFD